MPAWLLNVNWATLSRLNTLKEFALPVERFNSKHGFSHFNQCHVTIVALAVSNFLTDGSGSIKNANNDTFLAKVI